jgi:hypothetical protein
VQTVSNIVSNAVVEIQKTPVKIDKARKSIIGITDNVKETPVRIEQSIKSLQSDLERKQRNLERVSAYVWRVVTLEEAKSTYNNVKVTVDEVTNKIKDPSLLFASTSKAKNAKAPNALDKVLGAVNIAKTVGLTTVQAVTFVVNAINGVLNKTSPTTETAKPVAKKVTVKVSPTVVATIAEIRSENVKTPPSVPESSTSEAASPSPRNYSKSSRRTADTATTSPEMVASSSSVNSNTVPAIVAPTVVVDQPVLPKAKTFEEWAAE